MTPIPATLPLADVRARNAIFARLGHALRVSDTLAELRAHVASLAADIQDAALDSTIDPAADTEPATLREPETHRPWDDEQAPSTPRDSALGREYEW